MGFRSLIAILGHGANYYCRISGSFIPPVIDVAVCISRKEMRRRRLSSQRIMRIPPVRWVETTRNPPPPTGAAAKHAERSLYHFGFSQGLIQKVHNFFKIMLYRYGASTAR